MNDEGPGESRDRASATVDADAEPIAWMLSVLAIGLVACVAFDGLVRWVGAAAVLASAPGVGRLPAIARTFAKLRPHLPLFCVITFGGVLVWPLLGGDPPASRDHGIHYYQVRLLVDDLLPRGRTSGWVESFNNGYPYGETYPVLGYVWCAALHLLSFGTIELRTSYAFGLVALWALSAWAVARLGVAIAREVGLDRDDASFVAWTGAAGALLFLLDPGGSREGGWSYAMFHGVWPQLLSTSLWALSLTLTWDAFVHPSPRKLALASLTLGGSILAHPFGMLTAAASACLWLPLLALTDPEQRIAPGRWRWWAIVHGLGVAVALGGLVTFLVTSESMRRSPVTWQPLAELTAALVRGDLFVGPWVWCGPAALVGLVALVRRGATAGWLVLALFVALLVLGSTASVTVLQLDLVLAAFKNLQFPRYSIAIKPLFFAIAGLGAVLVVRALAARLPARPVARGLGSRFAAALLFAPLVASLLPQASRLVPRPIGGIDTLGTAALRDADAQLLAMLAQERPANGSRLRVALLRAEMSGATWPLLTLADADVDLVLDGHVPTSNFEHHLEHRNAKALAALGVTHVLWDGTLEDEPELRERLQEIGTFDRFRLARFDSGDGVVPQAAIIGPGTVAIASSSPDAIELDLAGTTEATRLRLRAPPHPKWHAQNGETELAIDTWYGSFAQMQITAPGDGRVHVRYVDAPSETRARWVSIAAAFLLVGALALRTPLPATTRLHSASARRLSWVLAILSLLVIIALAARRQSRQLRETWAATVERAAPGDRQPTFVRDLVDDGDVTASLTPSTVCVALHEKNALEGCSEAERATTAMLYREPYLYRCLEFTVPALGEARIEVRGVEPEQLVLATLSRVQHDGTGNTLLYTYKGRERPVGNRLRDLQLHGRSFADGEALVLSNERRRPERVCIAAAAFDP